MKSNLWKYDIDLVACAHTCSCAHAHTHWLHAGVRNEERCTLNMTCHYLSMELYLIDHFLLVECGLISMELFFLNLLGFSWLFNYANQELFLYTSSLRSIHKEFLSSCVDFQFHLCSILQKKSFSFQQRRIFVLMICRNKSLSKSSRLDSVKSLPFLFILGVCFQSYFLYHIFTLWIKFNFIRFSFVDVFWKQSIVIVIFIFSIYLRIAFHAGDNIIVGSREGKLCWFDMDLSSKPYRILKYVSGQNYKWLDINDKRTFHLKNVPLLNLCTLFEVFLQWLW